MLETEKEDIDFEATITKFAEFIEKYYYAELLEKARKGEKFLVIDFSSLSQFDPVLAEQLLEWPDEMLKIFAAALETFDIEQGVKGTAVRVKNLPETQNILIRNIRSVHLGKFLWMRGTVRQKSDVRPQVTSSRYECPVCGAIISVIQLDTKLKEPNKCGCGRKGKFKLLSKELCDAQSITLEEASEDLEGGAQPKRLKLFLKNDLVSPISDKKTNPGAKIVISGVIKEVPIILKSGAQSTTLDLLFEVNHIEAVMEEFSDLVVTKEDEEKILELSKDPKVYEKMVNAIAPSIYGYEKIKEALIYQIMGGVQKKRDDGVVTRGDMHVLLIGDPGCGKCLGGDTKIMLDSGEITSIKRFVESNWDAGTQGESCLNSSPIKAISLNTKGEISDSQIVRFWMRRSPKDLLKIKTATGNEIVATKNHPLFTTKDGLIFAKALEDYRPGDYIALPSNVKVEGTVQKVPKDIDHSKARNRVRYCCKEFIDSEFARLLGYLVGDGYVKIRPTTGLISFTNSNIELLDDFEKLIRNVFGLEVSKRKKQRSSCWEYYVSSIDLVRILENIDPNITKRSSDMSISRLICMSPDNVLKEFIKALFDCEAYISPDKRSIEFVSKSKELVYDLKYCLLRYGIISQVTSSLKYASNTKERTRRKYYRLWITGKDVLRFKEQIGFVSSEKVLRIRKVTESPRMFNTNLDIVPGIKDLLVAIRKRYGFGQNDLGVPRTTYQHYERGDRFPSYDSLRVIYEKYKIVGDDPLVEILRQISQSDIFWDKIVSIEEIKSDEEYVYDVEIQNYHNYVANGIVVHNSQLLKRVANVAPKSVYVSGKGASGAGLCVSPNSMLLTNPGGIETIKDVVEDRIGSAEEYRPGVWKKEDISDIRIQSLSGDLKIQSKKPSSIWKLEAPKVVFEITLSSGKRIEITGNTKLFSIKEGKSFWKKSMDLNEGDYVATPRKLIEGNQEKVHLIDFIRSNPVIHDVKPFVKHLTISLSEKYGSLRKASAKLGLSENSLYHNWVNPGARGNIKLGHLRKICEDLGIGWKDKIKVVSLYNGKKQFLPTYLTEDIAYLGGLVAGDGDLRSNGTTYSIRLSNSDDVLLGHFKNILSVYFDLKYDIQKGNMKRPTSVRTNSKILGDILLSLGIPLSPKSDKIFMSNVLLHLPNNILSHYIAGLYDTDGSVCLRKTKGSDCIEMATCSETLARNLQLALLRFPIRATIRARAPSKGRIIGKHKRWVLEIRGACQIKAFTDNIPLRHPKKMGNLKRIMEKSLVPNTNVDIVPGAGDILKGLMQKNKVPLKKAGWHKNLSNEALKKLLDLIPKEEGCEEIKKIAKSDIFWEKVVSIKEKVPGYSFVYDLTVEDSHNFVVDGVLVHNTASVVKDDFLQGWSLEAGALVLANKGMCMIDELDKMSKEDRSAMHEALEQQSVTISKANIQATLHSQTTVLAAANPKYGRFDPNDVIARQIDLPPTLINRFDLIFPIKDLPDEKKDDMMAEFILKLHQNPFVGEMEVSTEFLRKYIAYAKTHCKPKLSDEAMSELKNYYLTMRSKGTGEGVKSIPISTRQLEGLVRITEAVAKVRLAKMIRRRDAKRAIELLNYCLRQIAFDEETGTIDIDKIATGITASQRGKISVIKEIITELENKLGKMIPIEEISKLAKEKGMDEDEVETVIERLRRGGDIYEPRRGYVSKLG